MAKTRWLDEEEQRAWRAYLDATKRLFDRLDQDLQCESGMPHTYYEILVRLSESPRHTLRMSELADRSLSSRSRVSHAVARLEELGWVRREQCPTDRRGFLAVLTGEGFAALKAAAPKHVDGVRRYLFDHLSPAQVRQLGVISRQVLQHLQDE